MDLRNFVFIEDDKKLSKNYHFLVLYRPVENQSRVTDEA